MRVLVVEDEKHLNRIITEAMEDEGYARRRVERILASAAEAGAEEIITACPLCMYNLAHNAGDTKIPVKYFTELLYQALGLGEEA